MQQAIHVPFNLLDEKDRQQRARDLLPQIPYTVGTQQRRGLKRTHKEGDWKLLQNGDGVEMWLGASVLGPASVATGDQWVYPVVPLDGQKSDHPRQIFEFIQMGEALFGIRLNHVEWKYLTSRETENNTFYLGVAERKPGPKEFWRVKILGRDESDGLSAILQNMRYHNHMLKLTLKRKGTFVDLPADPEENEPPMDLQDEIDCLEKQIEEKQEKIEVLELDNLCANTENDALRSQLLVKDAELKTLHKQLASACGEKHESVSMNDTGNEGSVEREGGSVCTMNGDPEDVETDSIKSCARTCERRIELDEATKETLVAKVEATAALSALNSDLHKWAYKLKSQDDRQTEEEGVLKVKMQELEEKEKFVKESEESNANWEQELRKRDDALSQLGHKLDNFKMELESCEVKLEKEKQELQEKQNELEDRQKEQDATVQAKKNGLQSDSDRLAQREAAIQAKLLEIQLLEKALKEKEHEIIQQKMAMESTETAALKEVEAKRKVAVEEQEKWESDSRKRELDLSRRSMDLHEGKQALDTQLENLKSEEGKLSAQKTRFEEWKAKRESEITQWEVELLSRETELKANQSDQATCKNMAEYEMGNLQAQRAKIKKEIEELECRNQELKTLEAKLAQKAKDLQNHLAKEVGRFEEHVHTLLRKEWADMMDTMRQFESGLQNYWKDKLGATRPKCTAQSETVDKENTDKDEQAKRILNRSWKAWRSTSYVEEPAQPSRTRATALLDAVNTTSSNDSRSTSKSTKD